MPDVQYSDESYCAICDLYFPTANIRGEHIADSPNHPRCETCDRRFLNKNILRNHYVYSRQHHYCAACRVSFETAAGLKMHIEYASVHRDDSDDEDSDDEYSPFSTRFLEGKEDEFGLLKYPDEIFEEDDGDDDDDSWEHYDECDFEDEEDLGDIVSNDILEESNTLEKEDDDELERVAIFTCPVCKICPKTICSTPCGHLFCGQCIQQAYQQEGACPICEQPGTPNQLRRLYIST